MSIENAKNYRFQTALRLARSFSEGKVDPVEVTRHALAKAEESPSVFLTVTAERALNEAAESAARWQNGKPLSALDGVPIAWKDLFDIAGTVTTAGSRVFSERPIATADAPLVAMAAASGMVCIGKTTLSEFAYSGLGLNPHFGTPTNPFLDNGRRAPGGSSSGAAIAVAMGIVPIAVGTDTAGSIRVPCAFNGLTGYRSTRGRYDARGTISLAASFDTIGPIARNVADCVAFDDALKRATTPQTPHTLEGARFIVDPSLVARYDVTPDVERNFHGYITRLKHLGAFVGERELNSLGDVFKLIRERGWMGGLEAFALYRDLLDSPDAQRIDQHVRARLELARDVPVSRLEELQLRRTELRKSFALDLGGATLAMPTVAHVAPDLSKPERDPELFIRVNLATLAMTMLGSFLDTPTIAMPTGADPSGLPTGVQLMRQEGDDLKLLSLCLSIEAAFRS
ncbi:amidase [Paraburkholderia sp. CNPSo 3157]|uniref:Amidase n=1 Tax=Paraburkholderia franconis TaxID=2654983 RepID=A0A7X1NC40_9BURK|nr:amidase [Paraburkholderia franconis]MPW19247.1 amidase [Paraburkholderia franconis]